MFPIDPRAPIDEKVKELPKSIMYQIRNEYRYIDFYRRTWRLVPTGDYKQPLIIMLHEQ